MPCSIVGWSHLPFGKNVTDDLESLIASAASQAIAHAEIDASLVGGIWLGNLNGGFVPDIFASSLVLQADQALRWAGSTRVENACASGAAAVYSACDAIESGRIKAALVVGAELMTRRSTAEVAAILGGCSYHKEEGNLGLTFPGIFAKYAKAYFEQFGDHSTTLARIAAKNHANGVRNPYAQMKKDLGFDFCNTVSAKNPIVADPLRVTDCSLISDGAAALLIVNSDMAADFPRAVEFKARSHVNDYLPMSRRSNLTDFEGPLRAWAQAYTQAGCSVADLSFAEVHDCFTIAELLSYEAMGLATAGKGASVVEDGTVFPGGKLPVNASGGLKAKGHPIGATGVSMHVIGAMQLCGEAGTFQLPAPETGAIFNMGGSAVANYVSILRRIR
ncbi:acetyl-CoA acetyltransferase [Pseudorhodoferax sp. Leaf265]|uniref:acetyl-CoA acetyltransferase n=1 Tax=Pseudorhodoferax sp. Leaf265 TaxID=1736315 RepID=UPI0006FB1FAF|nr:acetyl-CoA acetyltransferase [Pseudorhodoferax sp. Leaf265]KQP12368.1 acetyl-CoA acetyltransferase [Pseudorhodoferax sp. Leaf265]